MDIHLNLCGWLLLVLALAHGGFPRYFRWREELSVLPLLQRQMMHVHTLFIAVVVLMMAVLCLFTKAEEFANPLGRRVALGFALFWTLRAGIQFFGYSASLWRGKRFETSVHIVFSVMWLYLSWVFWTIYFGGLSLTLLSPLTTLL